MKADQRKGFERQQPAGAKWGSIPHGCLPLRWVKGEEQKGTDARCGDVTGMDVTGEDGKGTIQH